MNTGDSNPQSLDVLKAKKRLKFVHVNIRNLLANLEEVKTDFLDGSLDIIALSETWLHAQCSSNLLQVANCNLIRSDGSIKASNGKIKRGGGIAVYIKTEFDFHVWSTFSVSSPDLELLCISCKLGNNKKNNLFVVYRPPTGKLQSAIDILIDNIKELRKLTSGDIVIMGDPNVDLLNNNVQARNLSLFAKLTKVSQLIETPTRITNSPRSLIDHIYTDITNISDRGTLYYNVTDHLPIFLVKKKALNSVKYEEIL